MKKSFFSIMLIVLLLLQCVPTAIAAEHSGLSIETYAFSSHLETVGTEVGYDGVAEDKTYTNIPTSGMQYLLVKVNVAVGSSVVDLDSMSIHHQDATYQRMAEDSFAQKHGYATLVHGIATIDKSGWLVFEVDEEITEDDLVAQGSLSADGGLVCGFRPRVDADAALVVEQVPYRSYADYQKELEASFLNRVQNGNYTPENPFIIVNPYEIAPQAALIIFETEEPAEITSVIHGKTEDTTIVNVLSTPATYHEVPLIGLYEGGNTVDLIVKTPSETTTYSHIIETALNTSDLQVEVQTSEVSQLSTGLYALKDEHRTLLDVNGDIRGAFTLNISQSGVDETTADGHLFIGLDVYSTYPTLLEVDYLGKVYREIQIPETSADHDAYLLDDSTLLLSHNIINLDTMAKESYQKAWSHIFNSTQGSFEVRNYGDADWLHFNTVANGGDGYILVSMRAQHAVAKLSYPGLEVQWVLSDNRNACPQNLEQYLTPVGDDFAWFYSQHDVSQVCENPDGTIDITLFDNGIQRGLDPNADYPAEDMYSRMVCYRIDESAKTVEQIWSYGEEMGTDALSFVHGSTQYIQESDTYLGNFDSLSNMSTGGVHVPRNSCKIVEVTSAGEVVLFFELDHLSYRTEKLKTQVLYNAFCGLGTVTGECTYMKPPVSTLNPYVLDDNNPASHQILDISATEDYLNVNGWVANPNALSEAHSNKLIALVKPGTKEGFSYYLYGDSSQTRNSEVPEHLRNTLDGSTGFSGKYINISDYEDGDYDVVLIVLQNGTYYYAKSEYTLRIGEKSAELISVPSSDLLELQTNVNQRLQTAFTEGNYTLAAPFVAVDPYELSPLSAIAMFKTTQPAKISISVAGLNGGKTITNDFGDMATDHTIPIYGLYAEQATDVTITATYADGTTETSTIPVTGNPLPDLLDAMSVDYVAEGAADDLIFCQPPSRVGVAYAIDNTGTIRWVFSDKEIAVATAMIQLGNGHFLTNSEKTMGSLYAESIYEIDYTGRIYKEYMINNVHHDTAVMPNGNILAVSGDYDNETLEDAVFELDGETGEVLRYWDLTSYFPVGNRNEAGELVSDVNYGSKTLDWFHTNSIEYRESDHSMVLSGRLQDAVIKINLDNGELAWILSDHDDLWPDALKDKLLTPVGDLTDFEWQFGQHNATWLPNGDLMLFDNGTWRSKDKEGIPPLEESYSRVVVYRIDEAAGTVEHVWQYGKELGHDYLSTFISSAQYLGENHYFMDFGGGQTDANGVHQYLGGPNRHAQIVELKDGVEVFKASNESIGITAGTYQALRLNIYNGTNELDLTQTGVRLSSNFKSNYVEESTLDTTSTNTFDVNRLVLEDNGTQLEIFATLTDVAETDTMYLYMVGADTYCFPVESKTTIQTKLNSTEVPVGQYHLYLTQNGAICDLEQVWNVDVAATPVPTCYDITVNSNMEEAGWISESGFYCKNTAVTLKAEAKEGYTFSGWQKDGVTVSTQPTYSFLPTADATFTAVFADESTGDVGGGSMSGGGGGGGSVGGDGTGGDTVVTPTFTDVDPDAYYYDAVLWAVKQGITDGTSDTTFSPNDVCTRAQAVTFLWNQAGKPVVNYLMTFTDVAGDTWYTEAVRWAVSEGITDGTSDTTFSPDAICTRSQIVTLLWNAAGKPVADQESLFTDVTAGIWYADAVQWAAAQTVTMGTSDTTFTPNDNCTRGQIVTFLYRNP